jgi:CubicO group peptidase (beta-lactamase class C family)
MPRVAVHGEDIVNEPIDRRNFFKRAMAASGAAWVVPTSPTVMNSSEVREGLNLSNLDDLKDQLAARQTTGLLIRRQNRTVYEWYAKGWGPERRHYTASMAKSLVGGMSLLLVLNDGRIAADDPAWKYIPHWKHDPLKSRITIRQLATHTSGLEDAEEGGKPHAELTGWKGDFWKRKPSPFWIAIHETPVIYPPGTKFAYSNPGFAALAYAITASLRGAPQPDIHTLLKERVMDPIGVPEQDWSIGYDGPTDLDGLKIYATWGGANYTAHATGRVGQLMLQRGEWNGRQLISRKWAETVVKYADMPLPDRQKEGPFLGSGLGWYANFDGVWPQVPRDAFVGAGAGHQVLLVIPSLDLVVVRNGNVLAQKAPTYWGAMFEHMIKPLMKAIRPEGAASSEPLKPPYPASRVIRKVTFAPAASIARKAAGSDIWPLTWADDDAQYTAYGDGWGFEPRTEKKLSLGFARVTGTADNFEGTNIRSASGEHVGDGPAGGKASGLLMVDGTLYMWVRNSGNAQLAWSNDHARTWHWEFRLEESFASPAFLQFGREYAGARDGFVYIYSQDGPSAYEPSDGLVLARVPKDRIRRREAYEFFSPLGSSGQPMWTSDIRRRGHVFTFPGHCQRVGAVYNPLCKRYLLSLGFDHAGGWGIFDAPEPWGPWTTAFFTHDWGLGKTHDYRLPSKWITDGGKRMALVFSGREHNGIEYDAFCVRRLALEFSS